MFENPGKLHFDCTIFCTDPNMMTGTLNEIYHEYMHDTISHKGVSERKRRRFIGQVSAILELYDFVLIDKSDEKTEIYAL
jgi:hypothetical protein